MATSPPSSSSGPSAASGSAGVDRPHTISSAYEKGGAHQRPQLTPYTFEQPTIPENGTAEKSMPASAKKPPVPQRCISLDATNGGNGALSGVGRPSLPRNK